MGYPSLHFRFLVHYRARFSGFLGRPGVDSGFLRDVHARILACWGGQGWILASWGSLGLVSRFLDRQSMDSGNRELSRVGLWLPGSLKTQGLDGFFSLGPSRVGLWLPAISPGLDSCPRGTHGLDSAFLDPPGGLIRNWTRIMTCWMQWKSSKRTRTFQLACPCRCLEAQRQRRVSDADVFFGC